MGDTQSIVKRKLLVLDLLLHFWLVTQIINRHNEKDFEFELAKSSRAAAVSSALLYHNLLWYPDEARGDLARPLSRPTLPDECPSRCGRLTSRSKAQPT